VVTSIQHVDSVVVGAGPAGLAAARELMRVGRRVVVLERGTGVASSWRTHRPGLRLHTVRRLSGLPGATIPRRYGRYVASANLVSYLENYASSIDVRFGVDVLKISRADDTGQASAWVLDTVGGPRYVADTVVMATGYNRRPFIPRLPGIDEFERPVVHVADYRGDGQYAGLDVLVVGSGNAAAEAAVELVATGARRVRMAVRTTPHIVRRRVAGVPMQAVAIAVGLLPTGVADHVASVLARLTVPDLSDRSMPRPRPDLFSRVRRDRSVPVHDTGIVALLETGAVEPVAAVVGFDAATAHLADGASATPDVVLFATGYRRALEPLLDGLGLLDAHGDPRQPSGTAAAPGFYFVGFTVTASGALRQMAGEARRVARAERRRANGRRPRVRLGGGAVIRA